MVRLVKVAASRCEVQLDDLAYDEPPFAGSLGIAAALALTCALEGNLGALIAIAADQEPGSAIDVDGLHFPMLHDGMNWSVAFIRYIRRTPRRGLAPLAHPR